MALSLYDITVPAFIRHLNSTLELLEKGERYADEHGIAHSKILETRLAPDMEPFTFQIRASTIFPKGLATNLGGVDPVEWPSDEASFQGCRQRLQRALDILQKIDKAKLNGGGETDVPVQTPIGNFSFKGTSYVLDYCLPNFYFHVTMTYGILRHWGVPIGKADFFGLKSSP